MATESVDRFSERKANDMGSVLFTACLLKVQAPVRVFPPSIRIPSYNRRFEHSSLSASFPGKPGHGKSGNVCDLASCIMLIPFEMNFPLFHCSRIPQAPRGWRNSLQRSHARARRLFGHFRMTHLLRERVFDVKKGARWKFHEKMRQSLGTVNES